MDRDDSMARVYLSIYISAASSTPRKEKRAMKSDQVCLGSKYFSRGPNRTCCQNKPEVEDFARVRMFCYNFAESQLFMEDPFEHILHTRC
jgi:hypothetical protein